MDKNTLWGICLMALVLFGFLYFTKPTQEEIDAARARAAQEQVDAARAETSKAVVPDTLSISDVRALAAAVAIMGQDGKYSDDTFTLMADSVGNVSGTITMGTTTADIADVLANRSHSLTPEQTAIAVDAVRDLCATAQKYKSFARHLRGDDKLTVLENDVMRVTFSSRGGRVSQVELKDYNTELTEPPSHVKLFRDDNDGYSFSFTTADQRFDTREFNFTPIVESDTSVAMVLELGEGARWGVRYTIKPDNYLVSMQIVQEGMDKILPASTSSIDFNWHQKMARNEKGRTFEERNSAIFYKYVGDSPDELNANDDDAEDISGRVKWVAFKNQFFSSVIIARDHFSGGALNSVVVSDKDYLKDMTMSALVPYTVADGSPAAFDFYFGPNKYPLLSSLDDTLGAGEDLELTRLIPLGWSLFRWINTLIIIPIFTFLGGFISNYGIIILLLTLFIKIILFPFTYKSFKSQARMRVLQPEIKAINDKYPGQENAMRRQQETMALYSRAGASPFSGCLPMLLQLPILVAMFSFFPSAIELRGEPFLWAKDLSAPDVIFTLPFTIPFYGNGVSLFCLLMTIVNVVYTRINMQNQPGGQSMPGMKWMMYLMPLMFLFFFNDYASGLSYYYLLSLFITIIQTWIFRRVVDEKKVREQMLANAKKPRKKSGFMARLEEAQRKQQAALRQQQGRQGRRK